MTSHVDAETLALSAEGLLDEEDERSVQEHVQECETCTAQAAELSDVSRVLAEVSAAPLPEDTARGIDEALRAEAESDGPAAREPEESSSSAVPPSPVPVTPLRHKSGLARWMPYIAAAAAAVFVVGGGIAIARGMMPTTAPDGNSPHDSSNSSSAQNGPDAAAAYQAVLVESGTSYTENRFDSQAAHVLEASGVASESDDAAEENTLATPQEVPTNVPSCAQEIDQQQDTGAPELVDLARFQGEDAWVMYYASAPSADADNPPAVYEVLILPTECGSGSATPETETTIPAP
ncbi:hypothetical protein FHX37_3927 [Haloactinospora alba]|uniref:Uncharacterized protein n=1 Tax=Haloactinospora alba TaxID=405555 RepID=A0A543N9W3_9ACTN|nr:hypothetical protein [Haloactinospora alba]TQN28579.1 hypothetical protein FHX37_3927 [Haloactinospora alba]